MSLQVIADVLGVPREDRMEVFRWSNAIGSLGIEDPDYAPTPEALGQAAAEMFAYCNELVAQRRKHGLTDDILSALLAAEVDGEKLNRDQLNEFSCCWPSPATKLPAIRSATASWRSPNIPSSKRCSPATPTPSNPRWRNCCAGRHRSRTFGAPYS